jgi:hypothetical protein
MEDNDLLQEDEIRDFKPKKKRLDFDTWLFIIVFGVVLLFFLYAGIDRTATQVNGCTYCSQPIDYSYGAWCEGTTYKEFKHWESKDNIDGVAIFYITTQGWFIDSGADGDPFIATQRIHIKCCPFCGRELTLQEGEKRVD